MAGKAGRGREGFGFVFNSNYHSKEYILQEEVEDVPVDKIHNVRKQCLPQKDPELLPNLCFSLKQETPKSSNCGVGSSLLTYYTPRAFTSV